MSSFEEFKSTLLELEPGERTAYHIGNLGEDRASQSTVHKIAILCQGLQVMGRVTLNVQRLDKQKSAYYITLSRAARRLQASDLTRAWTTGQEAVAAPLK